MSEPFRLRVMKALSAALEEINPDNGYMHDLRGRVFRGRDVFGDSDPIPMVSILEAIEEKERLQAPSAGTEAAGPWELLIQGFLDDDLIRSEEHTSELQSRGHLVCRLLLERTRHGRHLV